MLWLLMLHIAALLVWCAALIYLPVLVATPQTRAAPAPSASSAPSIERFIFTLFATPFALLAIVSGTLLFILNETTEPWLIVKLSAVAGLVICHALLGLLLVRVEMIDRPSETDGGVVGPARSVRLGSYLLLAAVFGLIATILWLVLAKPGWF